MARKYCEGCGRTVYNQKLCSICRNKMKGEGDDGMKTTRDFIAPGGVSEEQKKAIGEVRLTE
ncbi:MAG: hypothetical protein WC450_12825, partial [Candidatus Omnitrophota bacterium]